MAPPLPSPRRFMSGPLLRPALALLVFLVGCAGVSDPPALSGPEGRPPAVLLGRFVDDYDEVRSISTTDWAPAEGRPLTIERWVPDQRFLIAHSGDDGPWTRIDWVMLDDPTWRWGFCLTAWGQASADAAEEGGDSVARAENPRVGCNGSPFTRMRPIAVDSTSGDRSYPLNPAPVTELHRK